MKTIRTALFATSVSLVLLAAPSLQAQAPGVPIVKDLKEEVYDQMMERANALRADGKLLSYETVREQLKRKSCNLTLPKPATQKLTDREIWQRSRQSHVQLGYLYKGQDGEEWHPNLAGAYYITADGVVATCYHVLNPRDVNIREGYLFARTEDGKVYPVTEVLAGSLQEDVAIVRVKTEGLVTPLALNTNVYPGDAAWCYSDPAGRSCYFSKGMVNRFAVLPWGPFGKLSARISVSTDWAPNSSGSAVVDECGNAIGHVSYIETAGPPQGRAMGRNATAEGFATYAVFHYAARAADVLSLIKSPGASSKSEEHGGQPSGAAKP